MARVAAIAVDAAEWWYLSELIDRGALPNLTRFEGRARSFQLRTELPYRSELVWTRFLTGSDPIEGNNWATSGTFDPDTYGIGSNTASVESPFFAFGEGTKVVALDLIHSVPADNVDGVQVVAWGSHSPQWPRTSRPVGLMTEIDHRFGTNPVFGNDLDVGWHNPSYLQELAQACTVGANRRADIAEWLLAEQPDWDLFLTCFSEFHSAGHHMWHGVDPKHPLHESAPTSNLAATGLEKASRALDDAVGRLINFVGPQTYVVLFALHGFQPADDVVATVLLPELAQRHHLGRRAGLLRANKRPSWRKAGCPPIIPDPTEQLVSTYLIPRFADSTKKRLRRSLGDLMPNEVFEVLLRVTGRAKPEPFDGFTASTPPETREVNDDALLPLQGPLSYQAASWYQRHWPRMPWFVLPSFGDGHVRINLRGRERHGLVDKADYGQAIRDVERFLGECRDARTGAPMVADVLRMREGDPMDPLGADADLLVVFEGAPDAVTHPATGTVGPFPHLRAASHSTNGFAMIAGPGIEPGDGGVRPTADLPPTLLSLLGKHIPTGVQGERLI